MIKIFMKETTADSEDIIKTGTLNLVDLAGSENVGRSGAVDQRKKEAGMINQSLLTLGRVITALVEHQPHVPYRYAPSRGPLLLAERGSTDVREADGCGRGGSPWSRESKLTRMLQESLGGRTKTCIIATVSPNPSSIEETLSTMDYAHRAKNIRNKPEINQVMSKKALVKDLNKKLSQLEDELRMQRDRNGVYLDPERYTSLLAQIESQKEQIAWLETEKEERERVLALRVAELAATTEECERTKETLTKTEGALEKTEKKLEETVEELEETVVVKDEHWSKGSQLYSEAASLLRVSHDMASSIGGLHGKIGAPPRLPLSR